MNPSQKKKLAKNRSKTYEEYVLERGINAKADLLEAEASIKADTAVADTDYGALAEGLGKKGLSGSGYEDYMRSRVNLNAKGRLAAAMHASELTDYEGRSGYAKYMSDYEALQEKLSKSIIEKLSLEEYPDYDTMLNYAINAGLDGERAKIAASTSFKTAKDNSVYRAIAFAQNNGLSAYRAKKYALSEGLSYEDASRVYDAVKLLVSDTYEQYYTLGAEEYIDYLKERAEAKEQYKLGKKLK